MREDVIRRPLRAFGMEKIQNHLGFLMKETGELGSECVLVLSLIVEVKPLL